MSRVHGRVDVAEYSGLHSGEDIRPATPAQELIEDFRFDSDQALNSVTRRQNVDALSDSAFPFPSDATQISMVLKGRFAAWIPTSTATPSATRHRQAARRP
jgi:hypothetical protein